MNENWLRGSRGTQWRLRPWTPRGLTAIRHAEPPGSDIGSPQPERTLTADRLIQHFGLSEDEDVICELRHMAPRCDIVTFQKVLNSKGRRRRVIRSIVTYLLEIFLGSH